MLIGEDFVKAEDKYRRERHAEERSSYGPVRKLAVAIAAAAVLLAACGIQTDDTVENEEAGSGPNLIVDIAPVGNPSLSAIRGYQFPEMFPVSAVEPRITGYEYPEMWPNVRQGGYVEPASGPR